MSPVVLRRVLAPLSLALVVGGLAAAPSQASASSSAGAIAAPHALAGGLAAKRRHRAHQVRSVPRPSVTSVPRGVRFTWPAVPYASRYRVLWSAKPYGGFLDRFVNATPGGWISASHRSSALAVQPAYSSDAGQRAIQTALPYGNPVYARLQANNAAAGSAVRYSPYTGGAFPAIAAPAPGPAVRVGTWNLGQSTNVTALAGEISKAGLGVVALQESRVVNNMQTADRLAGALGRWRATHENRTQQQQLIYDASRFTADREGVLPVTNYKSGGQLLMPYLRLTPVDGGPSFWVVSAHFVVSVGGDITTHNRQTAADADQLARGIASLAGSEPVITAADFTSNREPYTTSSTGAQQVFVQHGYWDTRASLKRYGVGYSTYNGRKFPQPLSPVGVSSRSDYIMTKGIHGSTAYVNVGNQRAPLSDHNLVWSQVQVPG